MPTKAEIADLSSEMDALRLNFQESCHSWTDDLPVCPLSGVGFATNQRYRVDGSRREEHPFEDKSFHFRYDDNTHFYGVFDGHIGTKAADFASQRMPAEILLGQLKGCQGDQDVCAVLKQAFLSVEKGFFESIDDLLAEKENLRLQLQGLRTIEAIKQFPEVVQRLKMVTEEIQSGTTAVVALLLRDKLFIASVGDCRAILCTEDSEKKVSISQLSPDHTFDNEDEVLRLTHLGLDVRRVSQKTRSGLYNCTRCIGNYTIKGGYKEFDNLSEAQEEPIIAEPEICGGIPVNEKAKFLLLMSGGLYRALEEATHSQNVNALLVNMVLDQFSKQSTLSGVAQAVVDKIGRIHHDAFMKDVGNPKKCQKRDDITLLVRSFGITLSSQATEEPGISTDQNLIEFPTESTTKNDRMLSIDAESWTSSTESESQQTLFKLANDVSLDEDGRIKPYVDFEAFYEAVEEGVKSGLVPEDWIKGSV